MQIRRLALLDHLAGRRYLPHLALVGAYVQLGLGAPARQVTGAHTGIPGPRRGGDYPQMKVRQRCSSTTPWRARVFGVPALPVGEALQSTS